MPCTPRKARILLKEGKGKIIQYNPFTIQLTIPTGETVQQVSIGVDTGAKNIGIAITSEEKVLGKAEIELRSDIKENLASRKTLRRSRRNRKTRYRRSKFKYKTTRKYDPKKKKWIKCKLEFDSDRKDNWLPPSIKSRVDNTIAWINKFASLASNPKIIIEVGKFDVQKMQNPDIQGIEYQQGDVYGFWAIRYYVFARDNYTCQICKKKGGILHTHHIIRRRDGVSDKTSNLATVHNSCHEGFHSGRINHTFKTPKSYKETAFMNILRKQIFDRLSCKITYGNITTADRYQLGLEKSHTNDAIAISGIQSLKKSEDDILHIRQIRKNKRSLHESTARKGRKEPNRESTRNKKNTICQNGFYINDKVELFGQIGFISGFCQGGLYVKGLDNNYVTKPGKSYKQVSFSDVRQKNHNGNWQFFIEKDTSQFISHLHSR